jgi:hypothetical protein
MTERSAVHRRLQFSIRSLLIVTGLLALVLAPVAWLARHREMVRRAREDALRSVLLEHRYRAEQRKQSAIDATANDRSESSEPTTNSTNATFEIERLRRENAELKETIESLRAEIRRLKGGKR